MAILAIPIFFGFLHNGVPDVPNSVIPTLTGKEKRVTVASLSLFDCPKLELALEKAGIPCIDGDSGTLMTYLVREQDLKRARIVLKVDSIQNSYHINMAP